MLYSFGRIKVITRGKGKSSVATAAYHAATKIKNEYDGLVHDFRHKANVADTYIRMPDAAPEKYINESIPVKERLGELWNDVERFEEQGNAQLARQNYLALQREFTLEQNLECVDRFIEENCTSIGMGVTYSVHLKPGNPHVDIMYLMREFDENGNFKKKSQKEYLCRKAGEEKYLSAEEFRAVKEEGWEKVYKYRKGNSWKQLTQSEASSDEYASYKRASKHPVDRKSYVNAWNDPNLVPRWRKSWEVILNEKFEELGMEQRVDCRSYRDQGKEQIPTIHEGHGQSKTKRKEYNAAVKEVNSGKEYLRKYAYGVIEHNRQAAENIESTRSYWSSEKLQQALAEQIPGHERMWETNNEIISVITESGLLSEQESNRIRSLAAEISDRLCKVLEEVRTYLKVRKKTFIEAKPSQKMALDELINKGEQIKEEHAARIKKFENVTKKAINSGYGKE